MLYILGARSLGFQKMSGQFMRILGAISISLLVRHGCLWCLLARVKTIHWYSSVNRIIEPFQKGETPTFISHAKAGIQVLVKDPKGLLIFSGYVHFRPKIIHDLYNRQGTNHCRGPTKKPRTKVSEGGSYHVTNASSCCKTTREIKLTSTTESLQG